MAGEHILVVEDDGDINNLLAELLARAGYRVTQAYSGTEARLLADRQLFSLMLLDLMLPGLTGEAFIRHLREGKGAGVPVIVLSARETPGDKAAVLRLGADDYMTKPFDPEELLARVEACLRRSGSAAPAPGSVLVWKELRLDPESRQVTAAGQAVALTAREFGILELLMGNPHKVFTKQNLYRSVWNDEFYGDDNTVNVHISNLRSKLGPGCIQTVWGIGFKMQE